MPASALWMLIPLVSLTAVVLGGIGVMKLQRRSLDRVVERLKDDESSSRAGSQHSPESGLQQSPHESREAIVRRNQFRPGVVATGETLVDLYDRIQALEKRVSEMEQNS